VRYGLVAGFLVALLLTRAGAVIAAPAPELRAILFDVDGRHTRMIVELEATSPVQAAVSGKADRPPVPLPRPTGPVVPPPVTGADGGTDAAITPSAADVPSAPAAGACTDGALAASPLPSPGPAPSLPVIVIDPGHGGVDPGAIGVDGLQEKTVVLGVARALHDLLERTGRYQVVLTRRDDSFVRLRERTAAARAAGGNVFVSLHADTLDLAGQRGASVYTLSAAASDEEAASFASRENKADILPGTDLSSLDAVTARILIDLAQRQTSNRSILFADLLAAELARVTPLVHRHRRFADLAVLKSPGMPSVLVELGYISNRDDALNLASPGYRASLACAMIQALDRHFGRIQIASDDDAAVASAAPSRSAGPVTAKLCEPAICE
jgi:N-acetylmuramoyl-L-alanine amidase